MLTLLDLANMMDEKLESIQEYASARAVSAAYAIVKRLAYSTPVDTSQALSNWQVSLNDPNNAFIRAHSPGFKGNTQGASAGMTVQLAVSILQNKTPGQPIYITNNAPYIGKLNSGSSSQAPAGFVEAAVLIARQLLRNK